MKQINYILILLQLCCITACNDWLEVAPQAEKEESEMFEVARSLASARTKRSTHY